MPFNFSKIRTGKVDDPVAKYFCGKEHSVKDFSVFGIEKVMG